MWFNTPPAKPQGRSLTERLTARQLEVLHLAAQGLSNKMIALRLDIAEHTVERHLAAAYSKLGVGSRTEAAYMLYHL